jgi:Fe-S-cluster-containing hydrogenase component 2
MAKQTVLNPPAELEPRASDVALPYDHFLHFSFFTQMKRKPTVEKFPGTLVLRRFEPGEVLCRQGEAGWTAFYLLTAGDVLALKQWQLGQAASESEKRSLAEEIAQLQQTLEKPGGEPAATARAVATVYLAVPLAPEKSQGGFLRSLIPKSLRPARDLAGRRPQYIPIDGPTDVPYDTRQATLYEGELCGEMSCLYGTPRSATMVADTECYALEMLRNILDQVQKDEGYKAKTDETYKKRVLGIHLRRLSIFSDLTDEQFATIRDGVELIRCEAGELICDENDRSDSIYIIRSGLVKVMKNASSLLALSDISDWKTLASQICEGEKQPSGPGRPIWQALPEPIHALLRQGAESVQLTEPDKVKIAHALNDLIKDARLPANKELQGLATTPAVQARTGKLAADPKKWSPRDIRNFNRAILETTCTAMRPKQPGPEYILAYCSRGDIIGEMGLMGRQPRTATCVAYVHPQPGARHQAQGVAPWRDSELVELVRIPEQVFWKLIDSSPTIRQKVEKEVAERKRQDVARAQLPAWDDSRDVYQSEAFSELGLIQGQRLMLIDLDRCTRCDECVRACVDTHSDGRSRLFLDGPRFGKYLVPTTCRSCLDPVCTIGCPVGSIHRGDNREIVIEDWCIGCNLCARNCPYGSIQMHDLGIVPEGAHGWRYARAPADDKWVRRNYRDSRWRVDRAPFHYDLDLQAGLGTGRTKDAPQTGDTAPQAIGFRYEFHLDSDAAKWSDQFTMQVTSTDNNALVWINGKEITTEEKPKRGKRDYMIAQPAEVLRAGRNVVAVRVTPTAGNAEVLLDVRLDHTRPPAVPLGMTGEFSEKAVTERAVVCDLCSSQFGQKPACVNACPHDAAMRVDARFEFPVR